jgi:hypothetical protein
MNTASSSLEERKKSKKRVNPPLLPSLFLNMALRPKGARSTGVEAPADRFFAGQYRTTLCNDALLRIDEQGLF